MNTSEIPRRAPADYWSSVPIATTRRASIFRAPTRVERPSFTFPIKLAGRRETSWSRLGRRSVKLERSRRRRRRSGGGEAHDDGSTVDEPSFSGEKKRRVSRKQHHDPSIPRSFDLTILRSHDPSIPRSFDPTILRSHDPSIRRSTAWQLDVGQPLLQYGSRIDPWKIVPSSTFEGRRNLRDVSCEGTLTFFHSMSGTSLSFPLELRARISFRRCYG